MTAPLNGIPPIGLGTYGRTGEDGIEAIRLALELGYRHLDTAQSYGTEPSVAEAVRRSGLARDKVFVTTKVATVHLARETFLPTLERSLETLGSIDLTLVHWPSPKDAVPFEHYIEDLGTAHERGWTKQIGVSNFPIALLQKAIGILGPGRIAANQVEVHPYLQNRKLRAFCAENGIAVTAYMPLAKGRVGSDAVLSEIGQRHGATPGQVALAFLLAEGLIVIPSSTSRENLAANLRADKIVLGPDEMDAIRKLERGDRMINPAVPPAWDA